MSYKKANGKKFIGIFICAVAILIAACISVPFFSKEEGYRMITVFEVSGTVGVVKDGIEYEAYPGMHLQEGHVIVTSENSYARLVLDDDKYVKVEAGSRLEFETLGLLGTNKTRLKLDRGAITTEIVNPLGADEEYVVNTPNAVLAVRGTFFRVDLRVTKNGEIDTNVYTYGGKVASNRVMPTGEMVEEEVIVDAGFMTAIRMDALETIYIVGMTESPTGEAVEETRKNTVPIEAREIPDEDLVDMYFASENGHEMFLSTDEIKENIEEREISVEEQVPVYEKADEVKAQSQEESDTDNTTSTARIPDDRGDWEEDTEVVVEEMDEPQQEVTENVIVEVEEEVVPEEVVQETQPDVVVLIPPATDSSSNAETTHKHSYVKIEQEAPTCTQTGYRRYQCECGEQYTLEDAPTGHTEVDGGTYDVHTKCSECGVTISSTHPTSSYTLTERIPVGCETTGYDTYTCSCGYEKVIEHAPVGHVVDSTGVVTTPATCTTEGVLTKSCGNCGWVESTETIPAYGHTEGTPVVTQEATCTVEGRKTTSCVSCSEVLNTETIPATGHTGTPGGTEEAHEICSVCNEILDTVHTGTLTVIEEASCTMAGSGEYHCDCGYYGYETISAKGHTLADASATESTQCTVCQETLTMISSANFPDEVFLAYIESCGVDANEDGMIGSGEIFGLNEILIGDASVDKGVTDLTGMELFPTLYTLDCRSNAGITSIDLSSCSDMSMLYISNCTGLSAIDVSSCTSLMELHMANTNITTLDVSSCTNINTLDISNCKSLQILNVSNCRALYTIDVSTCPNLTEIYTDGQYALGNISFTGLTDYDIIKN